jgi:hypothetical protein
LLNMQQVVHPVALFHETNVPDLMTTKFAAPNHNALFRTTCSKTSRVSASCVVVRDCAWQVKPGLPARARHLPPHVQSDGLPDG